MRKKHQISQLETQVAELAATVAALLEVVTCPTPAPKTPAKIANHKARLRWSQEEKNTAVKLHANGLSAKDIGALLGRSPIAIANMLSEIRLGR
jgi:hypothetical protein